MSLTTFSKENPKVPIHPKKTKVRNTEVVHVKGGQFNPKDPTHIYIGRAMPGFTESIWANPFKMDKMQTLTTDRGSGAPKKQRGTAISVVQIERDGTREQVIEKYRAYVLSKPELVALLPTLKGKRLGCWCHPKACHGHVLKELADAS